MKKIATHNSATGEKAGNIISKIFSIFAKCQSKTLLEQWVSGCRLFDIRIKKHKDNWYCYHGLWRTKHTVNTLLNTLNTFVASDYYNKTYVMITYEGHKDSKDIEEFLMVCDSLKEQNKNLVFGDFSAKYPWTMLKKGEPIPFPSVKKFKALDGTNLCVLLPIPILWKQFFYKHVDFDNETFKFVDFL